MRLRLLRGVYDTKVQSASLLVLPVIDQKLTGVAQRRLVPAQHIAALAHAGRRRVVALLAVEGVLAAELLELLLAVLLGLIGGVC